MHIKFKELSTKVVTYTGYGILELLTKFPWITSKKITRTLKYLLKSFLKFYFLFYPLNFLLLKSIKKSGKSDCSVFRNKNFDFDNFNFDTLTKRKSV